jgi:hypothetical protein
VYGLKPDDIVYLSQLQHSKVIQICIGEHDLQFNFYPSDRINNISVGGRCELLDDTARVIDVWENGMRSRAFRFLDLPGQSVVELTIDTPNAFKLLFSNGQSLRLVDNSQHYESFSVGGLYV